MEKIPKYIQTELGTEKYCKGCGEYYPADREFFCTTSYVKKDGTRKLSALCRDCYNQRYRPSKTRDVHITTQQQWGEQKLNISENSLGQKIQLIWLGFINKGAIR